MRLKWKNSICLVYKLWIAFTVITFDFVKSLRNPNRSSYEFILSTSSAKEIFYSTKSPLISSRTAQLTDLLALPKHFPSTPNLSSAIPFVANKTEKIAQNEILPCQNFGEFNYVTESMSLFKKLVSNSLRKKSYSKRNTENKVNTRGKRHLKENYAEQQVRAMCRGHVRNILIPEHKQNTSLMDDREENPKTLSNHQESIVLQSLLGTTQPENSPTPTHIPAFTTIPPIILLCTNVTIDTSNVSDVRVDRPDFKETNGKVNNRHPPQSKKSLLYCNEEQQNSRVNLEKQKLSSVNLLHSKKMLVGQTETREQEPLHGGENREDENPTQVTSHEIGGKVGNAKPASHNFHILKTRNAFSKRSFISEEHVSEDVIINAFQKFTTTRAEETDMESEMTEFSESANNKRSESTFKMSIVKSYASTKQSTVSQELLSSPFTIIDNVTPSYESSEVVSYAIFNSNSTQENLEIQTSSSEQDDLIEQFKLKYPVKLWKTFGLLDDKYLKNINAHWMTFEPPSPIVHKIYTALYSVFMIVGCGANFIVIFMFSRCRSLRTPPNYLILNLAISDFFMMAKTPIYIVNSIYYGPALGQLGCSIYGFVGGLTGTASIMTLASIAVDRYYAIVHPLNPFKRTTSQRVTFMILFVWIYAALFSSLPLFGVNNYTSEGYLTSCSFDYLSENMQHRMFVFIFFLASWLFPLIVIMFSYANIFRIVRAAERMEIFCTNVRQPVGESYKCKPDLGRKHKSEVKIALLAGILISLWLAAWTPYALVALLGIFGGREFLTPFISSVPSLFCKTASCINPFVYSLNHPKFQRELRSQFKFCFRYHLKERNGSRNNSYCSAVTYRANDNLAEDADHPSLTTRRSLNLIKVTEANVELSLVKYDSKSKDIQTTNITEMRNSNSNSNSDSK